MPLRVYSSVGQHVLSGRLNLADTHVITARMIVAAAPNFELATGYAWKVADYLNDWSSGLDDAGNAIDIGAAVTYNSTTRRYEVTGDTTTIEFPDAPSSVYGVLFYRDTGSSATSPLIAGEVFTSPYAVASGAAFIYNLPADGIFEIAMP